MHYTFRFFISSTFSDFEKEREHLHKVVFPNIDEFCQKNIFEDPDLKKEIEQELQKDPDNTVQFNSNHIQLEFQPIDLRWGVNEEAQKDHKTMEICLSEVQRCVEGYPYPNFMLMIGNRYGWIPLPTFIAADEFEALLPLIKQQTFASLIDDMAAQEGEESQTVQQLKTLQSSFNNPLDFFEDWYKKDENQIPVAYRLLERTQEHQNSHEFASWMIIEKILSRILKKALDESHFSAAQKKYYATSATEAEFHYALNINKELKDNMFVFCRNSTEQRDHYTSQFLDEVKNKGVKLHETMVDSTADDSSDNTPAYVENLGNELIAFIQQRIKTQLLEKIREGDYREKDEKIIHQEFAKEKIHNYIGNTEALTALHQQIQDGINAPNGQVLLVHGASGSGKSAFIAKCIDKIMPLENKSLLSATENPRRIVYRFVGASAASSDFRRLFSSIFEELGVRLDLSSISSTEEVCKLIATSFEKIQTPSVIFIDAIDQLNMSEEDINYLELMIPASMPDNVKLIISALNDNNYPKDTLYYTELVKKSTAFAIPPFQGWEQLLEQLLNEESSDHEGYALLLGKRRSLTQAQKAFIEHQYKQVNTPFFIKIIHQEVKNWASWYDPAAQGVELGDSNQSAVQHFIDNLSKKYHHEQELVRRVLCWFVKTKEGLSEYQMRTLLDIPFRYTGTDNPFVRDLANSVCSQNIKEQAQKMPNVYWSRLFFALLPFLKRVQSEQAELLSFFHREFNSAVEKKYQKEDLLSTWEMIFRYLSALLYDGQEVNIDNALQTIKQQWLKLYNKEAIHYAQRTEEEHHSESIAFIEDKLALFKQKAEEDQARNTLTEDGQHERVWINEYYKSRVALSIVPFQNYPLDKANNNEAFDAASVAPAGDKLYRAIEYYHQAMLDTQTEFVHFNELKFSRKELAHYLKVAEIYLHTYLYLRLEKEDTSRFADFDLKRFQKSLLQLMLYAV